MDEDPDDTDDPEEKRRRIESRIEADNFGAIIGAALSIGAVIAEHRADTERSEEQAIFEREECNEYQAQNEIWQQTM